MTMRNYKAHRSWDNSIHLILRANSFIKEEPLPIWWYWVEMKGDRMASVDTQVRNKHQRFKELIEIKDKEHLRGTTLVPTATCKMEVQLR